MKFNNDQMDFNNQNVAAIKPVEPVTAATAIQSDTEFDESVVDKELFDTVRDNKLDKDTNSFVKLEFNDGDYTYLACTFLRIYKLKSVNPAFYKRYNAILMNGSSEVGDIVTQLYGAYLCAHINTIDKCMSEEEFMAKVPYDFNYLREINMQLTSKKKN